MFSKSLIPCSLIYGLILRTVRLTVRGRVQRVGYRRHVLDIAQELGIAGYARNEKDGSVIIFAQAEEEMLESFLKTVQNPPPPAQVRSIEMREVKPNPCFKTFEIKYGKLTDELQEGFGATQTVFINYWAEFKDYRQEFKEFAKKTDENFKTILDKYGEIPEKLTRHMEIMTEESKKTTEMLETMKREFIETRERLDNSLTLLREAVERLSHKS